jgi:hypothetical protein
MSIETSGKWWKGSEFADIADYLKALKPGGYDVDDVQQSVCQCGSTHFRILVDRDDELSQRECADCGTKLCIADSEEFWNEASPKKIRCPCKKDLYEIGIGIKLSESRDWVRWMSVGLRCVTCGVLSFPVDWKTDFELTDPMLKNI